MTPETRARGLPPATAAEVLDALEEARAALLTAAEVMAARYGQGHEPAAQLCGAALLISEDWMPAIRAEVQQ